MDDVVFPYRITRPLTAFISTSTRENVAGAEKQFEFMVYRFTQEREREREREREIEREREREKDDPVPDSEAGERDEQDERHRTSLIKANLGVLTRPTRALRKEGVDGGSVRDLSKRYHHC